MSDEMQTRLNNLALKIKTWIVRAQQLQSVIDKTKAGKSPSKADLKFLDDLEISLSVGEDATGISDDTDSLNYSAITTAQIFGIARPTIYKWTKFRGCPQEAPGRWNVAKVFDWWKKNIMTEELERMDETLASIQRKYWKHKAGREAIKEKHEEGKLIPKPKVMEILANRDALFVQGLENYAFSLPPLLEGRTQMEMRELIKNENKILRLAFLGQNKKKKTEVKAKT